MKKQRYCPGFSLMEVLIAGVIVLAIIMTFAMVFPIGVRLNATTLRANKAMEIANGVINEIKNMPLCNQRITGCPTIADRGFNADGAVRSLECLAQHLANQNPRNELNLAFWRPVAYTTDAEQQLIPPTNAASPIRIQIFFFGANGAANLTMPCDPLANFRVDIGVTLRWIDSRTAETKNVMSTTIINSNR